MNQEQERSENEHDSESRHRHGKEKEKIRIKYRQRVKIKKRPKGYGIKRMWRKKRKNIFAFLILTVLLGATMFMVVQVAKQELEKRQHEHNDRLKNAK